MAIVKLDITSDTPTTTTVPETIDPPRDSIFTELVPITKIQSLLKYVEGSPWTVNYYGQILNVNNTLEMFDPNVPNLQQPYYSIVGLVLQVTAPLTSNYDTATGITSVTGTAIVPYKVTPTVGDVFLAKVDSNEDAIFSITSVERKTYRKDTLYEISYMLHTYVSINPSYMAAIEQRVNEVLYFNKDTNYFNRDSLLKPSVKEAKDRLETFMVESQEYYLNKFVEKSTKTILIPKTDDKIYDPELIWVIEKVVNMSLLLKYRLNTHRQAEMTPGMSSIYGSLFSRSKASLDSISRKYMAVPSDLLPNKARLGGVMLTGIQYAMCPDTTLVLDESYTVDRGSALGSILNVNNYNAGSGITIEESTIDSTRVIPILPELFTDDYYVVSEDFYTYADTLNASIVLSYIETLIYRHISGNGIAKEDLAVTVEKYRDWSDIHQLYLLPVMWILTRSNI